jgi:hypothetical protein
MIFSTLITSRQVVLHVCLPDIVDAFLSVWCAVAQQAAAAAVAMAICRQQQQ